MLAAPASGVKAANVRLARAEQVKRYRVIEEPWIPEGGQLTPTMKLRRTAIGKRYSAEIEALYARGAQPTAASARTE